MKIAAIYPRFTGPYGGERLVIKLSQELQLLGDDIEIYTHTFSPTINEIKGDLTIHDGFFPKIGSNQLQTFFDVILMPLLVFRVRKDNDIILLSGWQSTLAALVLKKFKRMGTHTRIIYYCLEPPRFAYDLKNETKKNTPTILKAFLGIISKLLTTIDRSSLPSIDGIISISDWTANEVKNRYNRKSEIIYPGVEINRFQRHSKKESRKILRIADSTTLYLSVSKLHPRKRIDYAIDLFLQNSKDGSVFYIIGEGPERQRLEKKVSDKGITNVKILGSKDDNDVALYMNAADFFIFTAINEPFGIAPLEAKVAGCKVIPNEPIYQPQSWKQVAHKQHLLYEKFLSNNQ